jgi:hypothetical protein
MGVSVLACLLAGGLGLLAGGYYSVLGWAVVGSLLFLTTIAALIVAGASIVAALGSIALTLVTFNVGLMAALVLRTGLQPQTA